MTGSTAPAAPGPRSASARIGGELVVVLALCLWSRQPAFVAAVAVLALPGLRHGVAGLLRHGFGLAATAVLAVVAAGWWPGGAWALAVVGASCAVGALRLVREGRPTGRMPLPDVVARTDVVSGGRRRSR